MSGIGSSKPVCNDDATIASGPDEKSQRRADEKQTREPFGGLLPTAHHFPRGKPQRHNQTRRQHDQTHRRFFARPPQNFRQQTAAGRRQHGDQDVIFDHLAVAVLVHGHALGVFFAAASEPADELMQRAERTNPAAEKPAQQNRQHHGGQRPKQSGVNRLGGEQRAERHQRIELQQPVDRPAAQLPPAVAEGCDHAKPREQREEENLRDAPDGDDFHGRASFVIGSRENIQRPTFNIQRPIHRNLVFVGC